MTLKEYLTSNNLKPAAFARLIGTPASTVTRWLHGDRAPSAGKMAAIMRETGGAVTPESFSAVALPGERNEPVEFRSADE